MTGLDRSPFCAALGLALSAFLVGPASAQIRSAEGERVVTFDRDRSVFSRLASDERKPDAQSAESLAPSLGLKPGGKGLDGETHWVHEATGMEFVFVPAGAFAMGSGYSDIFHHAQVVESLSRTSTPPSYTDAEQPQKEVQVSAFFLGVYEVTVGQYRAFLAAMEGKELGDLRYPLLQSDPNLVPFLFDDERFPFWSDRQPIVGINWPAAWAFCGWMGGRLPTEAEWEKAARGEDGRIFPWGNRFDPTRANTSESLNGRTMPVGSYPGGRSPYGCYDMGGNASEFTLESFEESAYVCRAACDPALLERWPPRAQRTLRGGSWNAYGHLHKARTTSRERGEMFPSYPAPDTSDASQYLQFGFRVVLSPAKDLFPEGWQHKLGLR